MRFGYETTDSIGTGLPGELRGRETMMSRQRYANIGRPHGAGRAAGHGPDAATRRAWADLEQIGEDETLRMRQRLLELEQAR